MKLQKKSLVNLSLSLMMLCLVVDVLFLHLVFVGIICHDCK